MKLSPTRVKIAKSLTESYLGNGNSWQCTGR